MKHVKTSWISKAGNKVEMPWGHEISWTSMSPGTNGKTIFMSAGNRSSLKFNRLKNESLLLLSGEAIAEFGNELYTTDPILNPLKVQKMFPGSVLNVQSGCPYRISAITDCDLIEIGDSGKSEAVRIDDDYGRDIENKEAGEEK
jgi:hypothetical protein